MGLAGKTLLHQPNDLESLLEAIQADCVWVECHTVKGRLDLTKLPTFGGSIPEGLTHVLSWDKTRALVGGKSTGIRIVKRQDAEVRQRTIPSEALKEQSSSR